MVLLIYLWTQPVGFLTVQISNNIFLMKTSGPNWKLRGTVISAATVMLIFVGVMGYTRWNEAQVNRRIAAIGVQPLREAGDNLMQNLDTLLKASRGHELSEMQSGDVATLTSGSPFYEKECPDVIKQLKPCGVEIGSNYVFICFSGPPRMSICVFKKNGSSIEESIRSKLDMHKIGERVWAQNCCWENEGKPWTEKGQPIQSNNSSNRK